MGAGAPIENKNAEKWSFEEAEKLLSKAVELSKSKEYDFIGEVAKEQGTYHHVYSYIVDKYPELKRLYNTLKHNCETNCFYNAKKGNIVASLGIINLKSNHGWKDRTDVTTNDKPLETPTITFKKMNE